MSVIKVNTIQNANGTTALTIAANGQLSRVNTAIISDGTYSISANNVIQGSAKAWAKFGGGSSPAIQSSYNVSSITYSATGIWLMNFTTSMPDALYAVAACATASGVGGIAIMQNGDGNTTTYAFLIGTNTTVNVNWQNVSAVVFR
jgi:hypothetical protein